MKIYMDYMLLSMITDVLAARAAFCCTALGSTALHTKIVYPNNTAYRESVESYFAINAQLEPTCIVQPLSAEDVSLAVSTFVKAGMTEPCQFAVRSGGHTPWAGASNIEPGVTIDLSMMNSTTYHAENSTASILPGARWSSVYNTLSPLGVMVPGGRAASVGVGGLVLGGGISFFSARYGYVSDNVLNFEVVLASGEIINANNETNPDLFKALRGGSNNFGIVTRLDMLAFQQGDIWGGLVTYDNSTTSQHVPAMVNFNNRIASEPYASLITFWSYSSALGDTTVINVLAYTKPVANPSPYEEILSIANTSSTMRVTNVTDLTEEAAQAYGFRNIFLTHTFANDARIIEKAVELHNDMINEAKASAVSANWTMVAMFQPLPAIYSRYTNYRGGNVLGLDRFIGNFQLLLVDLSWQDSADDALFNRIGNAMIQQMTRYARNTRADNEYLYLNYADGSQNPLRGYGDENLNLIRCVAEKYDPTGVFQTQVPGGYKITAA